MGYGLVVGLNGTGDKRQTVFSSQSLTNLLARMGVQVDPTAILVKKHGGGIGDGRLTTLRSTWNANRYFRGGDWRCHPTCRAES